MIKKTVPFLINNDIAYEKILNLGFKKYPQRKKNYEDFLLLDKNKSNVSSLPIKMDVEITNQCNFNCKMCHHSINSNINFGSMNYLQYEKLLKLFSNSLVEVKLQGMGEPLLNKDIFKMIQLSNKYYLWTRLSTNASLLHINENYKRLIDSNPGEINISLDATTKEILEKIRPGSDFNQIIQNISTINNYCERMNVTKTRCWMLVQKDNMHEISDMIYLAKKLSFKKLTFSLSLSSMGLNELKNYKYDNDISSSISTSFINKIIEEGHTNDIEISIWNPTNKFYHDNTKGNLCEWIFSRIYVTHDYKITPCCYLPFADSIDFGSPQSLIKNWNGKNYLDFRKQHIIGKIPKICTECYSNFT